MAIDPYKYKPTTYIDEYFDEYLQREHFALKGKKYTSADDIDWDVGAGRGSEATQKNSEIKGAGVITVPGIISNGTDIGLPNLYVTKNCSLYELAASVKVITTGTITLTVKSNGITLGSLNVDSADTLVTLPVDYSLIENDAITVDVSGTHNAQDATVILRIKQISDKVK